MLVLVSVSVAAQDPVAAGLDREIWIGLRTDGAPGIGTAIDPFNGSGPGFDAKMQELNQSGSTNLFIHILPGRYVTRGTALWTPLDGWRIQGAGKDITTLVLTNVNNDSWAIFGVHPSQARRTRIEVSDMTIDCNYGPNNKNFAQAVALTGDHHTIRRVKAINAYGQLWVFENFVLYITSGSRESEGNLIEDCEVAQFKGTYCTAIGMGGTGFSPKYIQGTIRGNKVFDLKGTSTPSGLIAYGGGGFKDTVFENNVAYRCDAAVHLDTGYSKNVTFKGNQFIGCRVSGMSLYGQQLDNIVLEDNFVEMDPTSRGWGIIVYDHNGGKLTNFKIRNNVIRTLNNLASASSGLGISVANAQSFQVTGNRVDSRLRNLFYGPGMQLVDNTDFDGKPPRSVPGYGGNQIYFPVGTSGTVLLNNGDAYVITETGPNPLMNGTNLVAAYAKARTLLPNGQTLSSSNRAVVFIMPGQYVLDDSALVMSTPYVDLIGQGEASSIRLESEGNVIVQTAGDVVLQNLTLQCNATTPPTFGAGDKAAYFPETELRQTIIKNCRFLGTGTGWGMRLGVTYAGYYENCTAQARAWGGPGNFSGVAVQCSAGPTSFAAGGMFTGFTTNCTAGPGSFGAGGGFHGYAKSCTAGTDSFGGTGWMMGCQVLGAINPAVPTTGRLTDCEIGPAPGNLPALVLGTGARLYNCTVLANPSGTGYSLDAPAEAVARVAHCRLNRGMRNIVNLIGQPQNVEDPNLF